MSRNSLARYYRQGSTKINGTVRHSSSQVLSVISRLHELCDTVCRACKLTNRPCSSTVADTANRLLMRTDTEGSPSVAEENPLP